MPVAAPAPQQDRHQLPNHNAKEGAMGELCEKMRADLKIGGFSPATTKIYLLSARQFAGFQMQSPAELGQDAVRDFVLRLAARPVSRGTTPQLRSRVGARGPRFSVL
jgi:hypothetical protein